LGWNPSNFVKLRQAMCEICSVIQGRTELKHKVLGIDISDIHKPSKIVFSLFERLLRQGYTIGFNNYYNSSKLLDLPNELETDAAGTIRSTRKGPPRNITGKKLKKGKVAVCFRRK
jgi:hypothetical protein